MSALDIELSEDGTFGPKEMRAWLEAFENSPLLPERQTPIQRQFDDLAVDCLHADELTMGVAVAWLSALRAMGRHGEVVAFMLSIFSEANAMDPDQKCRVCGCTNQDCSGCIERTGKPCTWAEPDLCSACLAEMERKDFLRSTRPGPGRDG